MDSEDEIPEETDSGNESSDEDCLCLDSESTSRDRIELEDDFHYEVLTTEEIVQHMVDCIKEVNVIVQVYNYD